MRAHRGLGDLLLLCSVACFAACSVAVQRLALCAVARNRAIATIGAARTAVALYWVPIFGVAFAVSP
jgi:hypothetical protein